MPDNLYIWSFLDLVVNEFYKIYLCEGFYQINKGTMPGHHCQIIESDKKYGNLWTVNYVALPEF